MRFPALLAALLVLASGCLSVEPGSTTSTDGATCGAVDDSGREEECVNEEGTVVLPPPPGKYEIVDISEDGDLLAGVDKTWTWTTEPNAKRFQVLVTMDSPANGFYTAQDLSYSLVGGPKGHEITLGNGGPSTTTSNTPELVSYNGAGAKDNFGAWTLTLRASGGVGTWHVSVATAYDNVTAPA